MYTGTQVGCVIIDRGIHLACAAFASIIAVTAIGTVEPHLELVAAILGKFLALLQEHLGNVCILAIVCRVAVPRRDVETILHVMLLACLCKQLRNICVTAIFIAGILDAMLGSCCRP